MPVHFYAHAFDDDSNFLYEDSESLGNIDYHDRSDDPRPRQPSYAQGELSWRKRQLSWMWIDSTDGSGGSSYSTIIGNFDRWIMKDISVSKTHV